MASRAFPAPPDLAELLKFFEQTERSPSARVAANGHMGVHARTSTSSGIRRCVKATPAHRPVNNKVKKINYMKQQKHTLPSSQVHSHDKRRAGEANNHRSEIGATTVTNTQVWNASTQIQASIAKPLRHQILCRNFQPPAAALTVDPSETAHLVERLSKTTISSRQKGPKLGKNGVLMEDQHPSRRYRGYSATAHDQRSSVMPPSPPEKLARDGIQMLLLYRKEVEKRLRLDPSYIPQEPTAGT